MDWKHGFRLVFGISRGEEERGDGEVGEGCEGSVICVC